MTAPAVPAQQLFERHLQRLGSGPTHSRPHHPEFHGCRGYAASSSGDGASSDTPTVTASPQAAGGHSDGGSSNTGPTTTNPSGTASTGPAATQPTSTATKGPTVKTSSAPKGPGEEQARNDPTESHLIWEKILFEIRSDQADKQGGIRRPPHRT